MADLADTILMGTACCRMPNLLKSLFLKRLLNAVARSSAWVTLVKCSVCEIERLISDIMTGGGKLSQNPRGKHS